MENLISMRFEDLAQQLDAIGDTFHIEENYFGASKAVDEERLNEWKIMAKTLIAKACGLDSEYYQAYLTAEQPIAYDNSYFLYQRLKAVFNAARSDFEVGFLVPTRTFIQVEVLDHQLQHAQGLLDDGHARAAAIVAGTVLDTILHALCERNRVVPTTLEGMNARLAETEFYHSAQQRQISDLIRVYNDALADSGTTASISSRLVNDVRQILVKLM